MKAQSTGNTLPWHKQNAACRAAIDRHIDSSHGRPAQRALGCAAALSAVFFLAVCALWVLSCFRGYQLTWLRQRVGTTVLDAPVRRMDKFSYAFLDLRPGAVAITCGVPTEDTAGEYPHGQIAFTSKSVGRRWKLMGDGKTWLEQELGWSRQILEHAGATIYYLPIWALALGACVPPSALLAWRAARRRRFVPGFCSNCGYDLRESAERCPECGTAAPTSVPESSKQGPCEAENEGCTTAKCNLERDVGRIAHILAGTSKTPTVVRVSVAIFIVAVAVTITRRHVSKALATAEDPGVLITERIRAAQTLSEAESSRLQAFLLDRVAAQPGRVGTTDDIVVLGAIGDEETAQDLEKMEWMDESPYPGGAMGRAVHAIRSGPPSARPLDDL